MNRAKKSIIIVAVLIGLAAVWAAMMAFCPPRVLRRKNAVFELTVMTPNREPLSELTLRVHTRGWRYFIPILWGPGWLSEGPTREYRTDSEGRCTVTLRDDYLVLEEIIQGGATMWDCEIHEHSPGRPVITNRTIRTVRGETYTNSFVAEWSWGLQPRTGGALKKKCEIIVREDESSIPIDDETTPAR